MKNPKVKVIASSLDFVVEGMAILLIIVSFALPFIYYNKLQGEIPTHYNLLGQPDKWSQYRVIWLIPIIGLIIFVLFSILNKYPFFYRYPVKITDSNAQYLYTLGARSVRVLKLLVAGVILCFTFQNIKIGLGLADSISQYCIPVFLIASILLFLVMIFKMRRNNIQSINSN